MAKFNLFSGQLVSAVRNAGWMFFDRIFRMGTSLLVGIWLARYLGPDQYGVLNYAYVFPLTVAALASLGINTLLSTEIPMANGPKEVNQLVITSIFLKVSSGAIAFSLILGVNFYMHQHTSELFSLITVSAVTLLLQGFDTVDIYFQSIGKVHNSIIPKVVAFSIASVFRIIGIVNGSSLSFFISVSILELVFGYATIYYLFIRSVQLRNVASFFSKEVANKLLKAGWPIMIAEFFIFIYMRLDQIMIKYLTTSAELGKYSAALRISEAWYFIAGALTASFYPSIISLRMNNYTAYLHRYQSLLNILSIIGISISLVFTVAATPLTHLLYGSQYTGAGVILSIHIWTGLFVFLSIGSNNWFVVENLQTFLLGRTLAGAVINIILNFFLIPRYGAVGASVATLIAQFFAAYLTNGAYRKTREVFLLQTNALLVIPRYIISTFRQMMVHLNVY